jgi:hypothetical protein
VSYEPRDDAAQLDAARSPHDEFPWPPAGGPAIDAAVETWRRSVFAPAAFFRALPAARQLGPAIAYYLVLGMVVAAIGMFWQLALGPIVGPEHPLARWLGGTGGNPLLSLLLTPIALLGILAVAAVSMHAVLWLTGGARRGLAHTASVLAYAYGPQLFVMVPLAGSVIGTIWMFGVAIIGLREAHDTTSLRAAVAVLVPLLMLLVVLVLVVLAMVAAGSLLV